MRISRRKLTFGATALGSVAIIARESLASEPPKPATMVINSSGGAVNRALREAYFDEFQRRHGIRIIDTSPADTAKLRAMVQTRNIEWDVTEIAGQDGVLVERLGLLEPLDRSIIDLSRFPENLQQTRFLFPRTVYSTVLGYRTDVFRNGHPRTWAEFWDVQRFPGRRSMRNHPVDNLEYALLADGVPPERLYPLDVDRAFRKMDQIKRHVGVWWTAGAQPAQLLIDGEVDLATGWNGRFYDLMMRGAPVAIEWSGGAIKRSDFAIPKGARNLYWSQKFLALMTEPERQAIYANALGYPGLNLDMIKFVRPEVAPHLSTAPENLAKQFFTDTTWWADNDAAMQQRWNRWMLR